MTRIQKFRIGYCVVITAMGLWAALQTGHIVFLWAVLIASLLVLVSGAIREGE